MPDEENRIPVGRFVDCRDALMLARRYYLSVDGCPHCCPDCNGM